MHRPMEGVRVVEVAQFTFVPAAAAILADWGADVIKIEHAVTGDAQRGMVQVLGVDAVSEGSSFYPTVEGPNRGKRSVGLSLDKPEAQQVLYELVSDADVFMTNFLPGAAARLGMSLADIRTANPDIIYVSGSGFGPNGPEADKGAYDTTAFWARGGAGDGATPADADRFAGVPAAAFGDNVGALAIATGVSAALFGRERTGRTSTVDVSLLAVGAWTTQFSINLALMAGEPIPKAAQPQHGARSNPLMGAYRTRDSRWITLAMVQPGRYWAQVCQALGREDLVTDERFDTVEKVMANAPAAADLIAEVIAGLSYDECVARFTSLDGPWAGAQNAWEVGNDETLRANGYIADVVDADGKDRRLVGNPIQFDAAPATLRRAPQFAEHTDEILRELGRTDAELIELKLLGAIT